MQDPGGGWSGAGATQIQETALWLFSRSAAPSPSPPAGPAPAGGEAILCALPGVGPGARPELLRECGPGGLALYA